MGAMGLTGSTGPQGLTGNNGNNGANGDAATIAVGSVTSLVAGSTPTVVNAGTTGAAVFNFGLVTGNTGATGPAGTSALLPVASMDHWASAAINPAGNSFTITYIATSFQVTTAFMASQSLADSFANYFAVTAGTYRIFLFGQTSANGAIVQFDVDGVNVGAAIDTYSASVTSVNLTIATGVVLSAGVHTLKGTVTGRNASNTTGYRVTLTSFYVKV
jgi:hypothetical protein